LRAKAVRSRRLLLRLDRDVQRVLRREFHPGTGAALNRGATIDDIRQNVAQRADLVGDDVQNRDRQTDRGALLSETIRAALERRLELYWNGAPHETLSVKDSPQ
jgi:hypothetical protein